MREGTRNNVCVWGGGGGGGGGRDIHNVCYCSSYKVDYRNLTVTCLMFKPIVSLSKLNFVVVGFILIGIIFGYF